MIGEPSMFEYGAFMDAVHKKLNANMPGGYHAIHENVGYKIKSPNGMWHDLYLRVWKDEKEYSLCIKDGHGFYIRPDMGFVGVDDAVEWMQNNLVYGANTCALKNAAS